MRSATSDTDQVPETYAVVVGERLRSVRRQKRLSLQAVAAASGQEFKASVLGAYERGERAISVPRLQRLAALYDVPVDQLLPGGAVANGAAPAASPSPRGSRSGRVSIDLLQMKRASGELVAALQRFVSAIQVERQDFNGQVLTIRLEDLRVIGATFGLGVGEIVSQLDEMGLIRHR